MNFYELDIETNQVHNNSSQFMKQSLMHFHELAMNCFVEQFMNIVHELAWWTIDECS